MTDFFALFETPRQPWLDPADLKQKFYQLTRAMHPDLQRQENAHFQEINQAYGVLLDSKQRIQHLLELETASAEASHAVPAHLQELFPRVGAVAQRSKALLEQTRNSTGALSWALLKTDLENLRQQIQRLLNELGSLNEERLIALRQLNAIWNSNRRQAIEQLRRLYNDISYLTRWTVQLEEAQFQLSLC